MLQSRRFAAALLAFASAASLAACAPNQDAFDRSSVLRSEEEIKAPGMTVWLDEQLSFEPQGDEPAWVLRGRTSKNLTFATTFSGGHELGVTTITSPRKFAVVLDAEAIGRIAAGQRTYVRLDVATGKTPTYHVGLRLAPTLLETGGSSKVKLDGAVDAFVVGGVVVHRAKVVAPKSSLSLVAAVDEETFTGVKVGAGQYAVDLSFDALASVAGASEARFTAQTALATSSKGGVVQLDVVETGLTELDPLLTFPPETCSPAVLSCLESLAGTDSASCGVAREVLPCTAETGIPGDVTAERFADDLAVAVTTWYGLHGADVAAAGGNNLEEALAAIDPALVELVVDPEEDPHAHDLSLFVVFRHPDVAFPGSDIVWFGAYDKETGALEGVYDFN